jgi:hypothetical protein
MSRDVDVDRAQRVEASGQQVGLEPPALSAPLRARSTKKLSHERSCFRTRRAVLLLAELRRRPQNGFRRRSRWGAYFVEFLDDLG